MGVGRNGNLIPPKKGEVRNPKGKPKGTKSLSTIVRELESTDFDWSKVPIKQKDAMKKMGSPWQAIVYVAVGQAVSGDPKAREWLRKSGYGDKLDVTSDGEKLPTPLLQGIDAKANNDAKKGS